MKKLLLLLMFNLLLNFNNFIDSNSSFLNERAQNFNKNITAMTDILLLYAAIGGTIIVFKKLYDDFIAPKLSKLKKKNIKKIYFSDIGGYKNVKEELLEIASEVKNPNNKNTNMTCILLYGPPGTGKTYFAQAFANEVNLPITIMDSASILSSPYLGEAENNLKVMFKKAKKKAPSIIFIDEIDAILSHRNTGQAANGSAYHKVIDNITNLFLTHMDGSIDMEGVILIGATNNMSNMDPATLRSGRFENKIKIDIPNYEDRLAIIKIYLKKYQLKLDPEITIEYMAKETKSLTPADLNNLFRNIKQLIKKNKTKNKNAVTESIITITIFTEILDTMKLQGLSLFNTLSKTKKIHFSDIGGYTKIKEELLEIVSEAKDSNNKETNMTCVLLHGPPGTGKTYFAQALANETNIPIMILDSTDIVSSMYQGESEKKLKSILENAKSNSPCILFIDEIDTLFSKRGREINNSTSDNIKNLFLSYMDGHHDMKGVILIGATNNMSNMDPAFLRSGRFEYKFLLDIPTNEDRLKIIEIYLNKNELKLDPGITIEYMAKETDLLTSADLNSLFKNIKKIIKIKNKNIPQDDTTITDQIFSESINIIKSREFKTQNKSTNFNIDLNTIDEQYKKIFNLISAS